MDTLNSAACRAPALRIASHPPPISAARLRLTSVLLTAALDPSLYPVNPESFVVCERGPLPCRHRSSALVSYSGCQPPPRPQALYLQPRPPPKLRNFRLAVFSHTRIYTCPLRHPPIIIPPRARKERKEDHLSPAYRLAVAWHTTPFHSL